MHPLLLILPCSGAAGGMLHPPVMAPVPRRLRLVLPPNERLFSVAVSHVVKLLVSTRLVSLPTLPGPMFPTLVSLAPVTQGIRVCPLLFVTGKNEKEIVMNWRMYTVLTFQFLLRCHRERCSTLLRLSSASDTSVSLIRVMKSESLKQEPTTSFDMLFTAHASLPEECPSNARAPAQHPPFFYALKHEHHVMVSTYTFPVMNLTKLLVTSVTKLPALSQWSPPS